MQSVVFPPSKIHSDFLLPFAKMEEIASVHFTANPNLNS